MGCLPPDEGEEPLCGLERGCARVAEAGWLATRALVVRQGSAPYNALP